MSGSEVKVNLVRLTADAVPHVRDFARYLVDARVRAKRGMPPVDAQEARLFSRFGFGGAVSPRAGEPGADRQWSGRAQAAHRSLRSAGKQITRIPVALDQVDTSPTSSQVHRNKSLTFDVKRIACEDGQENHFGSTRGTDEIEVFTAWAWTGASGQAEAGVNGPSSFENMKEGSTRDPKAADVVFKDPFLDEGNFPCTFRVATYVLERDSGEGVEALLAAGQELRERAKDLKVAQGEEGEEEQDSEADDLWWVEILKVLFGWAMSFEGDDVLTPTSTGDLAEALLTGVGLDKFELGYEVVLPTRSSSLSSSTFQQKLEGKISGAKYRYRLTFRWLLA